VIPLYQYDLLPVRPSQEGEVIPLYQYDLQLGVTGEIDDRLFMVWPIIVEHRIDEDSPFWDLSADGLQQDMTSRDLPCTQHPGIHFSVVGDWSS